MIEKIIINTHSYLALLDLRAFSSKLEDKSKRNVELMGKLFLLDELIPNSSQNIKTYHSGKPYLDGFNENISISHSHDKLAIIVDSQKNTGVDIELIRDKVLKIRHKFLNKEELENASNHIEKHIIYWAAKETLYKIYGEKELDFIQHLSLKPFDYCENGGEVFGQIHKNQVNKSFTLCYKKIDEYIIVYPK